MTQLQVLFCKSHFYKSIIMILYFEGMFFAIFELCKCTNDNLVLNNNVPIFWIMSPPTFVGRHIVFVRSVCLSVCLSICLSVCPSVSHTVCTNILDYIYSGKNVNNIYGKYSCILVEKQRENE